MKQSVSVFQFPVYEACSVYNKATPFKKWRREEKDVRCTLRCILFSARLQATVGERLLLPLTHVLQVLSVCLAQWYSLGEGIHTGPFAISRRDQMFGFTSFCCPWAASQGSPINSLAPTT